MGIKVCPERNRHGEPPSFATLNQTCLKPTRPNRVTPSGTWYNANLDAGAVVPNKRLQQFEEVLAKERRLRHGGGVDAGRLELGVGPLDDRGRPLGLIGQAEFRIAKARPLSRVRRDAGSEVAFERIPQGARRSR